MQDIWTPDVKSNQLADVLSGIAPVRSVVNFGSGVANLVLLPFEQYRKDGRLVRGFQKGATAFARSTTLEALSVGARLATGTQVILEQAEAVLGGTSSDQQLSPQAGPSQVSTDDARVDPISRYAQQPGDLREGFDAAYKSLGENIRSAAQTILADVYERSATEVSPICPSRRKTRTDEEDLGSRTRRRSSCPYRHPQAHDRSVRGRLQDLLWTAQLPRSRRTGRGSRQIQESCSPSLIPSIFLTFHVYYLLSLFPLTLSSTT